MALTGSTMAQLGTPAPDFSLPDTEGSIVSLSDFSDRKALLVMFICNHCPYVRHIFDGLLEFTQRYRTSELGIVAVNSNDVDRYPQDGPGPMREEARQRGFTFPYLFDETQEVAKSFGAACTPDFFLFDSERRLVYRGQFDESRPGSNIPVTGQDLTRAVQAVLDGRIVSTDQRPSLGCNIKWKPGNEPKYFTS